MGIPKFYRWISERFPCLSETVKEYQIPEFDNLYLDMNGIIHVCSHPEDDNPHFRITEEKIFSDIFHYLEVLFRMIKPKKVFFMAVDGVAPRAKMNQQRGRRFRSAKEAENLVRKALEKGEVLPTEQRFDSNCITPGTEFMVRLHEHLKYFVVKKMSTDTSWQGVRVYLSGHETPGEGEHKVMDFIRSEKSKPGYDPNTRHCLYGLDADLMMLGLTSHEPHFSLLREEVRFGGKKSQKRAVSAEETTFHLLHLSLMREYLEFEFSPLKGKLSFPFDLESIIDDFVLMGFLVGNDFIPHLPHLHINKEGLPLLWKTYIEVLPTLDGYINEHGRLNLPRFEKYMRALSKFDIDQFSEGYADLKWLEGKLGGKAINEDLDARDPKQEGVKGDKNIPTANQYMALKDLEEFEFSDGEGEAPSAAMTDAEAAAVFASSGDEDEEEEDEDDDDEMMEKKPEDTALFKAEFSGHKANYYKEKLKFPKVTKEILQDQAEGYVRAIQWILLYYYEGVQSWGWFYEHHYAPYMSDVKGFSDMKMNFDLGTPFLPFQQLMAVLPSASKKLLPEPYQLLMTNEDSPVKDFYPEQFETDLNGKQQDWEAVVLIPFINEQRLLSAMEPVFSRLNEAERKRNSHGPCLLYEYADEPQGAYQAPPPHSFPEISINRAQCTEIPLDTFNIPVNELKHGLPDGVRLDVYFPGFPTLRHIPHAADLKKEGVKVFQMNSRGENMMLEILEQREPDLEKIAREYLGNSIYVAWPHMIEAKVIGISSDTYRYTLADAGRGKGRSSEVVREELMDSERSGWHREVNDIRTSYHDRKGVNIGNTYAIVRALPMVGRKYVYGHHGRITLEKQWGKLEEVFALQTTVKDITVQDPSFTQFRSLDELFPVKSEVFMLGSPQYGYMGKVLEIDPKNEGRVRVEFPVHQEPEFERLMNKVGGSDCQYLPGYIIAQKIGITSHLVSRVTGTIFIKQGSKVNPTDKKTNVGLNLKFNKTCKEVPGFTRKLEEGWYYSRKLLDVLQEYTQKYPQLFDAINVNSKEEAYYEEDIFGEDSGQKVLELKEFLKSLPCARVEPMEFGSELLEEAIIKEIEREVDRINEQEKGKKKHVKMQVRPHLLFRPLDAQLTLVPDPSVTFELFDRVINIRDGYSVPLGLRGTVIGIFPGEKEQDALYEVVFDSEFLGGLTLRCSPNRGYRVPGFSLINITHGDRKEYAKSGKGKPTAVVKPRYQHSPGRNHRNGYQATGSAVPQGRTSGGQYRNQEQWWQNTNNSAQVPRQAWGTAAATPNSHQGHADPRARNNHGRPPRNNNPGNSSEFDMIWKQLQASATSLPSSADPAQNPSLQQAGQLLRNTGFSQAAGQQDREHSPQKKWWSQDAKQNQPQIRILSKPQKGNAGAGMMSNMAENGQVSATQGDAEDKNVSEKSSVSSNATGHVTDNATVDKQADPVKESTAMLCQMLNIGSTNASSQGEQPSENSESVKSQPESKSSGPQYGRQVSLQELFQGAAKENSVAPAVSQPSRKGQGQPASSQGHNSYPQSHHKTPQNQPPNRPQGFHQHQRKKPVPELLKWCKAMGYPPPRFDYQPIHNQGVIGYVTLANGMRFKGSLARNTDQAAESAASITLLNMNAFNQGPGVMPPGGIVTSPNSAFTRVTQPGRGPPPPGFPPQMLPPGPYHHGNQRGFHGNMHQPRPQGNQYQRSYDHSPPRGQGSEVKPRVPEVSPAKNPFIPLQVARQQKTPQKSSDRSSSEKERSKQETSADPQLNMMSPPSQQPSKDSHQGHRDSHQGPIDSGATPSDSQNKSTDKQKHSTHKQRQSTEESHRSERSQESTEKSTQKKKTPPQRKNNRRPRARLAANFSMGK